MRRGLLGASGGGGIFSVPAPGWDNAASIAASLEALYPENEISVVVNGITEAEGYTPANGAYVALTIRDHAYTVWHYPELLTASQRRQVVVTFLSHLSVGTENDFEGGTLPAGWPPVSLYNNGVPDFKNPDEPNGTLPMMDSIHFLILILWTDWTLTGDNSTFLAQQAVIDDCLALLPRSVNGCVYSDPAGDQIDYGFTDRIIKTGDVAYGTALQAWAYKMCAEMTGESGSGPYTTLREEAQDGLATLRQPDGWYAGSSINQAAVDDVWATALIVAEELVSGADRTASATTLRDAYLAGTITQNGLVRHIPTGQTWADDSYNSPSFPFQNGGYWLTPLWDCYRAVNLVDSSTAHDWVQEALDEIEAEIVASGPTQAPYEYRQGAIISPPKGYTCHAALVQRFL